MNSYKKLFILLFVLMIPGTAFASGKANLDLYGNAVSFIMAPVVIVPSS